MTCSDFEKLKYVHEKDGVKFIDSVSYEISYAFDTEKKGLLILVNNPDKLLSMALTPAQAKIMGKELADIAEAFL